MRHTNLNKITGQLLVSAHPGINDMIGKRWFWVAVCLHYPPLMQCKSGPCQFHRISTHVFFYSKIEINTCSHARMHAASYVLTMSVDKMDKRNAGMKIHVFMFHYLLNILRMSKWPIHHYTNICMHMWYSCLHVSGAVCTTKLPHMEKSSCSLMLDWELPPTVVDFDLMV